MIAEDSNATTVTDAGLNSDLEDEAASHSGKEALEDFSTDPETRFLMVGVPSVDIVVYRHR